MLVLFVFGTLAGTATAAPNLELPGCRDATLPRNDDGSSGQVDLPFTLDFYGSQYDSLYVNNNGNVTFDEPLSTYVPFDLSATDRVIIAPFFADVDTRPSSGGTVTYGTTSYQGSTAFCVLWSDVGYYNQQTDRRNSFELLLVRDTPTAGDFDIVFRYNKVQWELGSASGNVPAYVGFSNGDPAHSVQLAGSGVSGAFLDGGPRSLTAGTLGGAGGGSYTYSVRSGLPGNDPRNVPAGQAADSAWWTWPDADDDGLPDKWETEGVWVGDRHVDLRALGADPNRKDAFVYVDVVDGERWNGQIESILTSSMRRSPLNIDLHIVKGARRLASSEIPRPITADGPDGDHLFSTITRLGFTDTGLSGQPGSVPALAKYVCVCPDHADVPNGHGGTAPGWQIGGEANGIRADHLVLTVYETRWMDKIERDTGIRFPNNDATSDQLNATVVMHELGHLWGLHHHGASDTPNDDPRYVSIMSYAYSAFGVPPTIDDPTTTGNILPRVDFSRTSAVNLDWRMGGQPGALSLIYGQHGERGNFYNTVSDIPDPGAPAPAEPSIDELTANPQVVQVLAQDAAAIAQATATTASVPPAAGPSPPTAGAGQTARDKTKPVARIRALSVGRLHGHGRRRSATVTLRLVATDDRTASKALKVRCRLDSGKAKSCMNGKIVLHVRTRGKHRLTITVTDGAGNTTTLRRSFQVLVAR